MEKVATDIYTFEDLRKKGFTHVDKTAQILPLVDESFGKQFFIARPRRFGKSLLVSTFKALFEGRRELFKGLCFYHAARCRVHVKRSASRQIPLSTYFLHLLSLNA